MNNKEAAAILIENRRMRTALTLIRDWDLPKLKNDDGKALSFEVEYGSNGARDYVRKIASEALND